MDYTMCERKADNFHGSNYYSFVFICRHCDSRTWGTWSIPDIEHYDDKSFSGGYYAAKCFELKDGCEWVRAEITRTSTWKRLTPAGLAAFDIIASYREEAQQFCEMSTCPVCGGVLARRDLRSSGRNPEGWGILNLPNKKRVFYSFSTQVRGSYDEKLDKESKKAGDKRYCGFIEECLAADAPVQKYVIDNTDQLKQFLGHLVSVEKNIYTISERLKDLYRRGIRNEAIAKDSLLVRRMELKVELNKLDEELKIAKATDITQDVKAPKYKGKYPVAPIEPIAPSAPVLTKPGLFNKKRIMAQNAALMVQFDEDKKQYDAAMAAYNKKLAAYNDKLLQIQNKQEDCRLKLLTEARTAHAEKCKQLEDAYLTAKEEYEQSDVSKLQTAEMIQFCAEKEEIVQGEELLKKLYQVRKQMYGSGVIFEKYHDFVAVSSFYEYISSGRCSGLEGANGAYNLYENEIRMNAIVAQLSDVVKSLKQIQKNQFTIYSAITQATNELKALNNSAEVMNKSLTAMKGKLTNISENSDVIAHNSKITAYYTRKNAELTDALGYLIALK